METSNQTSTKSGTSGAGRTSRYKSTRGSCVVDPTVLGPEGTVVTPTHYWASDRVPNISVVRVRHTKGVYGRLHPTKTTRVANGLGLGRTREARSTLQHIGRAALQAHQKVP
jgi:hypothetical protein